MNAEMTQKPWTAKICIGRRGSADRDGCDATPFGAAESKDNLRLCGICGEVGAGRYAAAESG